MRHTRAFTRTVALLTALLIATMLPTLQASAAEQFADSALRAVWERTDGPVAASAVQRTFLWGPAPITPAVQEKYAQSPNGMRLVQYFDKSRMEITNPSRPQNAPFYVTNGLLVTELMAGKIQTGNDPSQVEPRDPANINVVGDGDDPFAPTYQTLAKLRDLPARMVDAAIHETVDRGASIKSGGVDGVTVAVLEPETRHAVASVFWAFMNSSGRVGDGAGGTMTGPLFPNPFYATGLPMTEAYWTTVRVGGAKKQVLIQAFERRVLTYTPGNPVGFEIETGNVGQHYYQWRYPSRQPTAVDPTIPVGPIQPVNVLDGKYNLLPSDLPDRFRLQLDGEASNGLLSKNDADPNYGTYLKQWQRLTGYRRVFLRNEANGQVSAVQSLISVYRTPEGALATLAFNRDRQHNAPNVTITEGVFGANSYLMADRTNETVTQYSLVWQQANVLASVDITSPVHGGPTPTDALDLAQKMSHRITADAP